MKQKQTNENEIDYIDREKEQGVLLVDGSGRDNGLG